MQTNQAFALNDDFDITTIPSEFSPLAQTALDARTNETQGDDKLFIQFKTEAVMNPHKSTKAGRPIFDDVDMIVIRTPGSQLTSIVSPVKYYMQRFGDKYRKWKAGQNDIMSGTPLENFPQLFGKPSLIAELKSLHIHTVEQLAELPDIYKQKIMGGFELAKRASEWISKSAVEADNVEKQQLLDRIALLESMMTNKQEEPKPAQQAATKKG
jgi:hypothetical protein